MRAESCALRGRGWRTPGLGAWMRSLAGHDGPGIGSRSQRALVPMSTEIYGQCMRAGKHICQGLGGGLGRCDLALGPLHYHQQS
jgi:hypothetical protein